MNIPFSQQLQHLRTQARLTNAQLAERANIPASLISGLQNNIRRIGELQARRLGAALHLTGDDLESFVLDAVNTSAEKVLKKAQPYPASLINLLALQLDEAGVAAEAIEDLTISTLPNGAQIDVRLRGGRQAQLLTTLQLN